MTALALLVAAPAAGAVGAGDPPAAPQILEARLEAEPAGSESFAARLTIRLSRAPDPLALVAVVQGPRRVGRLTARLDGRGLELLESPATGARRSWRAATAPASGAEALLELSYLVEGALAARGAGRVSLLVPLVHPALAAAPARAGLFQAALELPDGLQPWEGFPSVPFRRDASGRFSQELQVLPGFVRVEAGPGGAPLLLASRVADGITLGTLLLLTGLGLRALRARQVHA